MNGKTAVIDAEENDTLDIYDLLTFIRRRIPLLVVISLIGAVICGFIGAVKEKKYESMSQIYIVSASNNSVVNLSDLQIGSSLALDYQKLMVSRPMMESVLTQLNLDYNVKTLRKMIEITNPADTRILEIAVTTNDPQLSADIANELAELAIDWLPTVMKCEVPTIAEDAVVSNSPVGLGMVSLGVLGAVGTLVMAVFICLLCYLLNDTIRSPDDLERIFGITPLCSIPEDRNNPNLAIKKNGVSNRHGLNRKRFVARPATYKRLLKNKHLYDGKEKH